MRTVSASDKSRKNSPQGHLKAVNPRAWRAGSLKQNTRRETKSLPGSVPESCFQGSDLVWGALPHPGVPTAAFPMEWTPKVFFLHSKRVPPALCSSKVSLLSSQHFQDRNIIVLFSLFVVKVKRSCMAKSWKWIIPSPKS